MRLEVRIGSEPSWLENLATHLANSLALDERTKIPARLYFEDSKINVGINFDASGRNLRLSYQKQLISYNPEGENDESQEEIKKLADLFGTDSKSAMHLASRYLKDGPFFELLYLSNDYHDEKFDEKTRAGIVNYVLFEKGRVNKTTTVITSIDSNVFPEFLEHLRKEGMERAEFFYKDLKKRETGPLPLNIAKRLFSAYQKDLSPDTFSTYDSINELSEFIRHIVEF